MTATENPIIKTTFNLYQSDTDWLKSIAASRDSTVTVQLRSAIAFYKFMQEAVARGDMILIKDSDDNLKQIKFNDNDKVSMT